MIRRIAIYDLSSGHIGTFIEVQPNDDPADNVSDGQSWCEGAEIGWAHYIKDGKAKLYPERPGDWAVFDLVTEQWTDPRGEDQRRSELISQIRQYRDVAISRGVTVSGHHFDTDEKSQIRLQGALLQVLSFPTDAPIAWKTSAGVFVDLTGADVREICAAMRSHIQACFNYEATLTEQIATGGHPDISTGWPTPAEQK